MKNMRSWCAAFLMCASSVAMACNRSPSQNPAAVPPQDELKPVGTTGTFATAPPPAGFELVNLRNGPSYVNCGVDRRPVVRQLVTNGSAVDHIECVNTAGTAYAPVATRPVTDRTVTRERVVRTEPRRSGRSWQKSALVIGGATAAGAGVGALVGGKKGALIGALAGGGAGTVYEVHKRRKHRR